MTMLRGTVVALALLFCAMGEARAQVPMVARVVTTCGTVPTAYVTGSNNPVVQDVNGNFCVGGTVSATITGATSNASSGVATSSTNVPTVSYNYVFNGTTWDQLSSLTVGTKHAPTVAIVDASGNQITSFGSTTSNAPVAAATATATTSVLSACQYLSSLPTFTNTQQGACIFDVNGRLLVSLASAAPLTPAAATATKSNVTGGQYNSTQSTFTDGQQGAYQMTARGELKIVNMDAGGNARGANVTAASTAAQNTDTALVVDLPPRALITTGTAGAPSTVFLATQSAVRGTSVDWRYAAAANGISNTTTAVTVKTAGSGSDRNCITAIDLSSGALGAGTEFAIRDGAGGTVLWRFLIGTAGLVGGFAKTFPTPICGTAATLLEVVTLTASITGALYVNAQGYTAL